MQNQDTASDLMQNQDTASERFHNTSEMIKLPAAFVTSNDKSKIYLNFYVLF